MFYAQLNFSKLTHVAESGGYRQLLVYIIQHLYNMDSRISSGLIWLLWMSRRLRGVDKERCIL